MIPGAVGCETYGFVEVRQRFARLGHRKEDIADVRETRCQVPAPLRVARILGDERAPDLEAFAMCGKRARQVALELKDLPDVAQAERHIAPPRLIAWVLGRKFAADLE